MKRIIQRFTSLKRRKMQNAYFVRKTGQIVRVVFLALMLINQAGMVHAQETTGNVRGVIKDESGAVVAGADVKILDPKTNNQVTTQSTATGDFEFKNLPVGSYKVTVTATGFKALTLSDVTVQLNQTTDLTATLTVGAVTESVNISAGGAELVDTTTTNLAKGFEARQVTDLAQTSVPKSAGIYNLALIAPNVVSTGGVGVGT